MKKITRFLLVAFVLMPGFTALGNPIIWAPLLITELHFDASGNWTLEINVVQDPMIQGDSTLDHYRIVSKSGSAMFNPGIPVHLGDILLFDASDFQTPLNISPSDERLSFEQDLGTEWYPFGIELKIGGTMPGSVPPLLNGQSVHLLTFVPSDYYYVKSNVSSLGDVNINHSDCRSFLNGIIYDELNNPVPANSINVYYYPQPPDLWMNGIPVNSDGSYSLELYACNNVISAKDPNTGYCYFSTVFPSEPSATGTLNIILDTLVSSIAVPQTDITPRLSVSPNPANSTATLYITLPDATQKSVIKLYNEAGEILAVYPVNTSIYTHVTTVSLNFKKPALNAGMYYLALESTGKAVASCKLMIVE